MPPRPRQGLTSVEAAEHVPEPYWRAAGFHVAGRRAVRIDMLERLSDLIRARVAFRATEGGDAPDGATGDGGFRVVPDLMSVVGCSGEEFASILKALGFKRERRPIVSSNDTAVLPAPPSAEGQSAEAQRFDEIWRPSKRKDGRHDNRPGHRPKRQARGQSAKRREQKTSRPEPRAERKRPAEHSPFAALEVLKGRLAARHPEKS
jgi:ATP-dependent RNA helicase SUPV3L1/SUV3